MKRLFTLLLSILLLLPACTVSPTTAKPEIKTAAPTITLTNEELTEQIPPPPPSSTEPPIEVKPSYTRISFLAAGDNVIHPCIYKEAKQRATKDSREYNFLPVYESIAQYVKNADIAFINQETLMGGEELGYSGYPRFNSPQDLALDLKDLGFDVINIANNHMCDKGEKGLKATIEFLSSIEDITLIGGHLNEADFDNIRIVEKSGIKIAFLSYTYGTNGLSLPKNTELFVPYIDEEAISRQISKSKEISDVVLVSVHWGEENHFDPSAEQISLSQKIADWGADAIIGHHPHVIQPIKWLEGKNGNKTLCIYSLGNLISAMNNGYNMLGGLMTFEIVRNDLTGEIFIDSPLFIPTAFYYADSWFQTKLHLLRDYGQELSLTHGSRKHGKLATRKDMEKYLTDTIAPQFLPLWVYNPEDVIEQ